MQIRKLLHSCLLVEEGGKTILIDPGNYSVEDGALDINTITKLDAICITHEHVDHFYLPMVKNLVTKFSQVQIFSNDSVKNILAKENIAVTTTGNEFVSFSSGAHERIFGAPTPPCENVVITLFNKLTHVGDSLQFKESADILALPLFASWGSTTQCVEKALTIQPKIIIPIHDWQWKDTHKDTMYNRLETFFAQHDILFKKPKTSEVVSI